MIAAFSLVPERRCRSRGNKRRIIKLEEEEKKEKENEEEEWRKERRKRVGEKVGGKG